MSEIDEWFNKSYWPSYPADLCGSTAKKGSKAEALARIKDKIKPDKEMMALMSKNLSTQLIEARKDQDPTIWPHLITYLNKKRYLDVIETVEGKPVRESVACNVQGCTSAVHGPDYPMCTSHLPAPDSPVLDKMRALYKEQGLMRKEGETKAIHAQRLRAVFKSRINGIMSMPEHLK